MTNKHNTKLPKSSNTVLPKDCLDRVQGCLIGQLVGDALGSLVEFKTAESIITKYPDGVREMVDGGTWDTIAGQPTDDSELALMLARTLVKNKSFDVEEVHKAYLYWLNSHPFDRGDTIVSGLIGEHNPDSQANGALMRISPLGIFGVNYDLKLVADWARQDAAITHIHQICQDINALFCMAIAHVIRTSCDATQLYEQIVNWHTEMNTPNTEVNDIIRKVIQDSAKSPPEDFIILQGWVLIAFQNALYQLLHAPSVEDAIVNTVMMGGDTDTNAAICGALLGAVYGLDAIPNRWTETILNCRPQQGLQNVRRPRPECFWPVDALELAEQLLNYGEL